MDKLKQDLEHILLHTKEMWVNKNDLTIFLTGGTGFFGKWLLHSFVYINNKLKLNNRIIVLTRNEELFLKNNPEFNDIGSVSFFKGDIRDFDYPTFDIDYIIHAATDANETLNTQQPLLMFDTIVEGTRRILELGKLKKVTSILHTSSGAVYGLQSPLITHIKETEMGCPDIFAGNAVYGEGKRVAEMLASIYYKKFGVPSKIARCFAFVGPYLPLDAHFAIGNFINNVLHNKDIFVNGDGTPYRSYLYSSDLAIWLWTILFKGELLQPYNVGSDESLTIEQLANKVASFNSGSKVYIAKQKTIPVTNCQYVPSVDKAKSELGLMVNVNLTEAVLKTINFYKNTQIL